MHFTTLGKAVLLASMAPGLLADDSADASASGSTKPSADTYLTKATVGAQVLINQYWNASTGTFGREWWNTAAAMTQLADLQAIHPNSTSPSVPELFATTFKTAGGNHFLNGFYDDEGWWALAWIAAYDLTRNTAYLDAADAIWNDMKGGWFNGTGSCGGGIWWDKKHTYLGDIENGLFISVSAHLANRTPAKDKKAEYILWAEDTWRWFAGTGMLNVTGGIVQNGYDVHTCTMQKGQLTYEQGVMVGGLLELNRASPKKEYINNATAIADATIAAKRFTSANGIFMEPVGGWTNDTMQFKGIFMRNLNLLQRHVPKQAYVDFTTKNADSVWDHRYANGQFGPSWDVVNDDKQKPYMSSHSSGLAALIAAGAMEVARNTSDPITKRSSRFWSTRT